MTEHEIQRELVKWFRQAHPGVRVFAIPNGGARSPSQGARLKSEGVSPGVPDLFIPAWRLWVEVKAEKGRLSPVQADWLEYLASVGYTCCVVYGLDAGIKTISDHKPLKS